MAEIGHRSTTRRSMQIGLRGRLAFRYITKEKENPPEAQKWVRKLVQDAAAGHPQLAVIFEKGRMVIGLKSDRGKYGDW